MTAEPNNETSTASPTVTDTPLSTVSEQGERRIKKLSALLINQLAAGEVITRPAAVVKELIENAIDAGASHIAVYISQGGLDAIHVSDNGCGIYPEDLLMAVTRHATSKVADIGQLQGIDTLGFRGEALAAMAAVSRLSLTSSADSSGVGRCIQVAGVVKDTPVITPAVHPQGTSVVVQDLYFNVPARRANLKSLATEFAHIYNVVTELALACADVNFELHHDRRRRLLIPPQKGAPTNSTQQQLQQSKARLVAVLGSPLPDHALSIWVDLQGLTGSDDSTYADTTTAHISGWLWLLPDQDRNVTPKKRHRLLYINGRRVSDPTIEQQLKQSVSQAGLGIQTALNYALFFQLPTVWLNANVHPSKRRIKIAQLPNIMAHLQAQLVPKLRQCYPVQTVPQHESNSTPSQFGPGQSQQQRQPTAPRSRAYVTGTGVDDIDNFDDINDKAKLSVCCLSDQRSSVGVAMTARRYQPASAQHRQTTDTITSTLTHAMLPMPLTPCDQHAVWQTIDNKATAHLCHHDWIAKAMLAGELPQCVCLWPTSQQSKQEDSKTLVLWVFAWRQDLWGLTWRALATLFACFDRSTPINNPATINQHLHDWLTEQLVLSQKSVVITTVTTISTWFDRHFAEFIPLAQTQLTLLSKINPDSAGY